MKNLKQLLMETFIQEEQQIVSEQRSRSSGLLKLHQVREDGGRSPIPSNPTPDPASFQAIRPKDLVVSVTKLGAEATVLTPLRTKEQSNPMGKLKLSKSPSSSAIFNPTNPSKAHVSSARIVTPHDHLNQTQQIGVSTFVRQKTGGTKSSDGRATPNIVDMNKLVAPQLPLKPLETDMLGLKTPPSGHLSTENLERMIAQMQERTLQVQQSQHPRDSGRTNYQGGREANSFHIPRANRQASLDSGEQTFEVSTALLPSKSATFNNKVMRNRENSIRDVRKSTLKYSDAGLNTAKQLVEQKTSNSNLQFSKIVQVHQSTKVIKPVVSQDHLKTSEKQHSSPEVISETPGAGNEVVRRTIGDSTRMKCRQTKHEYGSEMPSDQTSAMLFPPKIERLQVKESRDNQANQKRSAQQSVGSQHQARHQNYRLKRRAIRTSYQFWQDPWQARLIEEEKAFKSQDFRGLLIKSQTSMPRNSDAHNTGSRKSFNNDDLVTQLLLKQYPEDARLSHIQKVDQVKVRRNEAIKQRTLCSREMARQQLVSSLNSPTNSSQITSSHAPLNLNLESTNTHLPVLNSTDVVREDLDESPTPQNKQDTTGNQDINCDDTTPGKADEEESKSNKIEFIDEVAAANANRDSTQVIVKVSKPRAFANARAQTANHGGQQSRRRQVFGRSPSTTQAGAGRSNRGQSRDGTAGNHRKGVPSLSVVSRSNATFIQVDESKHHEESELPQESQSFNTWVSKQALKSFKVRNERSKKKWQHTVVNRARQNTATIQSFRQKKVKQHDLMLKQLVICQQKEAMLNQIQESQKSPVTEFIGGSQGQHLLGGSNNNRSSTYLEQQSTRQFLNSARTVHDIKEASVEQDISDKQTLDMRQSHAGDSMRNHVFNNASSSKVSQRSPVAKSNQYGISSFEQSHNQQQQQTYSGGSSIKKIQGRVFNFARSSVSNASSAVDQPVLSPNIELTKPKPLQVEKIQLEQQALQSASMNLGSHRLQSTQDGAEDASLIINSQRAVINANRNDLHLIRSTPGSPVINYQQYDFTSKRSPGSLSQKSATATVKRMAFRERISSQNIKDHQMENDLADATMKHEILSPGTIYDSPAHRGSTNQSATQNQITNQNTAQRTVVELSHSRKSKNGSTNNMGSGAVILGQSRDFSSPDRLGRHSSVPVVSMMNVDEDQGRAESRLSPQIQGILDSKYIQKEERLRKSQVSLSLKKKQRSQNMSRVLSDTQMDEMKAVEALIDKADQGMTPMLRSMDHLNIIESEEPGDYAPDEDDDDEHVIDVAAASHRQAQDQAGAEITNRGPRENRVCLSARQSSPSKANQNNYNSQSVNKQVILSKSTPLSLVEVSVTRKSSKTGAIRVSKSRHYSSNHVNSKGKISETGGKSSRLQGTQQSQNEEIVMGSINKDHLPMSSTKSGEQQLSSRGNVLASQPVSSPTLGSGSHNADLKQLPASAFTNPKRTLIQKFNNQTYISNKETSDPAYSDRNEHDPSSDQHVISGGIITTNRTGKRQLTGRALLNSNNGDALMVSGTNPHLVSLANLADPQMQGTISLTNLQQQQRMFQYSSGTAIGQVNNQLVPSNEKTAGQSGHSAVSNYDTIRLSQEGTYSHVQLPRSLHLHKQSNFGGNIVQSLPQTQQIPEDITIGNNNTESKLQETTSPPKSPEENNAMEFGVQADDKDFASMSQDCDDESVVQIMNSLQAFQFQQAANAQRRTHGPSGFMTTGQIAGGSPNPMGATVIDLNFQQSSNIHFALVENLKKVTQQRKSATHVNSPTSSQLQLGQTMVLQANRPFSKGKPYQHAKRIFTASQERPKRVMQSANFIASGTGRLNPGNGAQTQNLQKERVSHAKIGFFNPNVIPQQPTGRPKRFIRRPTTTR